MVGDIARRVGLVALAALAGLLALSASAATKPRHPLNADACKKEGWLILYTRTGASFRTEGACVTYASGRGAPAHPHHHGPPTLPGQLIVRSALVCLRGGWESLGSTSGRPFAGEQACVDFANHEGRAARATADLAIATSVTPPAASAGDTVTVTVKVSDLGPAPATRVAVADLLPAGLTFASATLSEGSYAAATGVWTVGTVTMSTPEALTIQAMPTGSAPATNTATITHADERDPNTANNSAAATLLVQAGGGQAGGNTGTSAGGEGGSGGGPSSSPQADLALTKSGGNPAPNVGDTVTFTLTLSDLGPDTATGVRVADLLPAGLAFVSATPSQGTYDALSGLWTVGTVTTATPETLQLQAQVLSAAAQTNTATISHADQPDPNTANNSASATETPLAADLALTKSVSNPTPNVGDTVAFAVTLSDKGPVSATGVTVQDLLPAGLAFVSATTSQGTYDAVSGVWTVGTVTTATPETLQLQAQVVSPTAQTNTATVAHADQPDPNTANNSASATETPLAADLALTKSVSNPTPNVGDTVAFTVTLSDNGPSAATNVAVADLLPAGLTFVSATTSQGTYNAVSGVWTVGTVTTATPETLQLQAQVVSPTAQTNTATVAHADQFDPNTANNSASATETPQEADLALAQTATNFTPAVGSDVTFTVSLLDNGPDQATNVFVADVLPAGVSLVSATPSQGSYGGGEWTVGTVAAGASATLQITVQVTSSSSQTNTATILGADQFDPNTANNSASVTLN
jgi:uncharacterized repeat protein (TIGR01451 family)